MARRFKTTKKRIPSRKKKRCPKGTKRSPSGKTCRRKRK